MCGCRLLDPSLRISALLFGAGKIYLIHTEQLYNINASSYCARGREVRPYLEVHAGVATITSVAAAGTNEGAQGLCKIIPGPIQADSCDHRNTRARGSNHGNKGEHACKQALKNPRARSIEQHAAKTDIHEHVRRRAAGGCRSIDRLLRHASRARVGQPYS